MAGESIHKQEFIIRNLATQNVTLYPAKAHIIRNIDDITLKPGANEITIYGLTPTADEDSIKVDGKGSATITDLMVELIPNREDYDNIYPEISEDDESEDEEEEDEGFDAESEVVKGLVKERKENEDATK